MNNKEKFLASKAVAERDNLSVFREERKQENPFADPINEWCGSVKKYKTRDFSTMERVVDIIHRQSGCRMFSTSHKIFHQLHRLRNG